MSIIGVEIKTQLTSDGDGWSVSKSESLYIFQKIIHHLLQIIRPEKKARIGYEVIGSVTRLGEISPLWQNFKRLCKYLEGLFSFGNILNLL